MSGKPFNTLVLDGKEDIKDDALMTHIRQRSTNQSGQHNQHHSSPSEDQTYNNNKYKDNAAIASDMNEDVLKTAGFVVMPDSANNNTTTNNSTQYTAIPQQPQLSESETATNDSASCYKMQAEFRRHGWNVAGANLLAFACWLAQKHFLYARPRLTRFDFGVASVIALGSGVILR